MEQRTNRIRRRIVDLIYRAKSGHPGGSLSCVEILDTLFFEILQPQPYTIDDRSDIFVLSKGHAAPALYATMVEAQLIPNDIELRALYDVAQGHPSFDYLPEVRTSTGSLGAGFAWCVGASLALKRSRSDRRVYCLVGDGELQEGIVAEAARIASYYRLGNLVCIVDANLWASDEYSAMTVQNPRLEFTAWGWRTAEVNGNDVAEIKTALEDVRDDYPTVIIAHTIKGKGVSFWEGSPASHGSITISDAAYKRIIKELE